MNFMLSFYEKQFLDTNFVEFLEKNKSDVNTTFLYVYC